MRRGVFAKVYPRELPGGMAQRACICRMLISNPAVLFRDDPISTFDELTHDVLHMEMQRICSERNATAFLVLHSLAEAVILSRRIIGEIVIDLPRPRLLERSNAPHFGKIVAPFRDLPGKEAFA